MINVHSHTRILETLKPYQATTWSDQDLRALTLDLEPPWPTLNKTTTNSLAYFTYPIDFMECLDKLVVIFLWWHTCLPEDGRRIVELVKEHLKIVMSRRKNYTNHHLQEVYLHIKDQAYLQTTSLKGTKHFHVKGKLTPRFIGPLQDHCKMKNRRLPARVTTWVTHCAQHFFTQHHSENVSNS